MTDSLNKAAPPAASTPSVLRQKMAQQPAYQPGAPVPGPYPYASAPPFPAQVGVQPVGLPLHACMGLNSCRGSDRFGIAGNPVTGPNNCAGQGYCSTGTDHTCHVQNDCRNQGGCGLYGTADEMNNPGHNDCSSLGSCATPINAERFSTNGPNQGMSVWVRAREVFETKVWPNLRNQLLQDQANSKIDAAQTLPETLGRPPALFEQTGPSYLWISTDNTERSNMTACGGSGMSGAGGCS